MRPNTTTTLTQAGLDDAGLVTPPLRSPGPLDISLASLQTGEPFGTVLIDPPWRFHNRTGKVAPEHRRLARYRTMTTAEIAALPLRPLMAEPSHGYLWVPNALLAEGLLVLEAWGFTYRANLVWHKVRKDGGSDGRGVGFYFRNVTELVLFGTRGKLRTAAPGRRQVNLFASRKREHSRKPDELYHIIEHCSPGPYLELFARHRRPGWSAWGDEAPEAEPHIQRPHLLR
jgi:N6-adenosine-specific RNA methylase IME4